ncbi:MAG: RNA 2',3'-cyclic phosphodiesterase [Candidatus Aminicenantes bacterium]|nr:RNA 2',3'-cyclic phosphodiesterase [Candidatus Aminicenantes bacterium]
MRTFIAINLDPEIKKTLSLLIDELDKGHENVRWVKHEGMHLTLKFLGEIGKENVPEIEDVLKMISNKYYSFSLKFIGTGSFPPGMKNPRVLWIGIEEEETLRALQYQLEGELEKLGFPRERRKFHAHLTLGRVKSLSNIKETLSLLEQYRDRNFGEMKADKISFIQSTLKPTGAEYSVLSEFELK